MEIGVEEGLDAGVGGAEPVAQKLVFLVVIAEQGAGEVEEVGIGGAPACGQAERCQLEIDIADEFLVTLRRHANGLRHKKVHRGTKRGRLRLTFSAYYTMRDNRTSCLTGRPGDSPT